jgi:hypothetical protein
MGDWDWVGPVAGAIGKGVNSYMGADKANAEVQAAYEEMLKNLQARMGDYDALGSAGYSDIAPQQVGPTALDGVNVDPASQQAQQQTMAALADLAANGGLSLADMKVLNDIQANINRNASARSKGLANQFAARGQLGSGAQLAMELQGNSDAAMRANDAGESAAAQAQARALQALIQRGQMGRQMGSDQYNRDADRARAHDLIEARNAAARTDAGKYNNSLRGQAFEDQLAKARGKTQLTGDMNAAVFGRGAQNANTTLGKTSATNGLIDSGTAAFGKMQADSAEGDSDPDVSTYDDEDDTWNNGGE